MTSNITTSGFGDLNKALEDMRQRMCDRVARKAVRAGAEVIATAMQEAAPIRVTKQKTGAPTPLAPGELKADIKARNTNKDGEIGALAGPTGKTAFVANWVEFGHREVHGGYSKMNPDGTTRGPGTQGDVDVPAHPFLRPAFDASVEEAETARDEVLREGLEGKA